MDGLTEDELDFHIMSRVRKEGIDPDELVDVVYRKIEGKVFETDIRNRIDKLIEYRVLSMENGLIYPGYKDYEFIILKMAIFTLERFGPLQIRDLSTYILQELGENRSVGIVDIENIIKRRGGLEMAFCSPPPHLYKKVSNLYCLKSQLENAGKRFLEYSEPSTRVKLRERLGILSEEDKKYIDEKIKTLIKDEGPHRIDDVINGLEKNNNIHSKIVFKKHIPARDGNYRMPKITLDKRIREYLSKKGISSLYSHQALAIEMIMSKQDVVLATSSASGKSMSYMIPIIQTILDNPHAKFLYIAPTKSLTHDQKNKINEFSRFVLGRDIANTFDGHTPYETKQKILKNFPNVILTNEHELHYVILKNHEKWRKFLKNLELIIVDEVHWYKGVFGSHVANIFRRLNVIATYYGSFPTYICLSATIGNPREFVEKLIGKKVKVITEDGSPKPERLLLLWEPHPEEGSPFTDVANIVGEHIASHLLVLTFGRSRNMVEMMTKVIKEKLYPELKKYVSVYRAGLTTERRREIENKFFSGKLRALVSTSAMELGIDVGELDSVVMYGYPGSLSSFWQRANRAGRRNKKAAVHYIPMNNPLDQYFIRKPDILTNRDFEKAYINPDNEKILDMHAKCMVDEIGLDYLKEFYEKYGEYLFINFKPFVDMAIDKYSTHNDYIKLYPEDDVNLRGGTIDKIGVYIKGTNKKIAEVDMDRAPNELFERAIYMVEGEKYRVKKLLFSERRAIVEKELSDNSTIAVTRSIVFIDRSEDSKELMNRDVVVGKGRLRVKERFIKYKEITPDGDVIKTGKLDFPDREMEADGLWITFSKDFIAQHPEISDFAIAIHGLVHTIMNLTPLYALCDISDIAGTYYQSHKNFRGNPGIFIYETNEYGVGIIDILFENIEKILEDSLNLLSSCSCEKGCPNCIFSPYCPFDNNNLDKRATIKLIKPLLSRH